MNRKGPLITLLAGFGLAAVLISMSMVATSRNTERTATKDTAAVRPSLSASPTASPTPSASPSPEGVRATYAGRVTGGVATVAVAIKDGQAVAYVCDGRRVESWLKGTASEGKLNLTNPKGASLRGEYGGGKATGSVSVAGKQFTFAVPAAAAPGGLYRAATTVNNARVVGGWIVLPDGTQVGVLSTNSQPAPAPRLDTSKLTANVNGATVTAKPIDGSGL
jgi:hypothetical protein